MTIANDIYTYKKKNIKTAAADRLTLYFGWWGKTIFVS